MSAEARAELAVAAPEAVAQRPSLRRGTSYDFNAGGKILLPASLLQSLSTRVERNDGPLVFRVSAGGQHAFVGVLEFTAAEGSVVLPAPLQRRLAVGAGDVVLVEAARALPKATAVTLRPQSSAFLDVPDAKAALTGTLQRHFLTLSQGDTVRLTAAGATHELQVTKVEPADGALIVDTDLAVDFEPPADADAAADGASAPTPTLTLTGGAVAASVGPGERLAFRVAPPPTPLDLEVRLVPAPASDASLFLSAGTQRPSLLHHDWRFTGVGAGAVVVRAHELPASGGLFGVVEGHHLSPSSFELGLFEVAAGEEEEEEEEEEEQKGEQEGEQQDDPNTAVCPTCSARVPAHRLDMHEAFCARNNRRCPHPDCLRVMRVAEFEAHWHCPDCGVVVAEPGRAKHREVEHAPLACSCGEQLLGLAALTAHRPECPDRIVLCRYCGSSVVAGRAEDPRDRLEGLSGHEAYCGSRTIDCHHCGAAVAMKLYKAHILALHGGALDDAAPSFEPAALPEESAAPPPAQQEQEDLPVDWTCEQCTYRNLVATDECQACALPRPAEGPNSKAAAAALRPPAPVDVRPGEWACAHCTLRNVDADEACSACGKARAQDQDRPTAVPRAVVEHPRAPRVTCGNAQCRATASECGEARRLGVCSTCFALLPEDATADDLEEPLRDHYWRQLRDGCARVRAGGACANAGFCCVPEPSRERAAEMAAEAPGKYYVCVRTAAAAPAPAPEAAPKPKPKPGGSMRRTKKPRNARGRGGAQDRIAGAMFG